MQPYAVDCMLHIVIDVYSVLYFSVSLRQCSAFVSILWLHALGRMYTCVVDVWFASQGCGVHMYLYTIARSVRLVSAHIYYMTVTCMSPSATSSATCTCIVNACNNTLLHAFHIVGRYVYIHVINLNITYIYYYYYYYYQRRCTEQRHGV